MTMKKASIILAAVAVLVFIAVLTFFKNSDNTVYTTVPAERGEIIQTVSETGTVKASQEINLSFLNSGQLKFIHRKIGEQVEKGDILAELDYSNLEISEKEAAASLEAAKSSLNKLLAGATAEETALAKAGERQAKSSYESSKNELEKTVAAANESVAQAEKTVSDLELDSADTLTSYEQSVTTARTALGNTISTYQSAINDYLKISLNTVEDKLSAAKNSLDIIDRTINDEDGKDLISKEDISYLDKTVYTHTQALVSVARADSALALAKANNSNELVLAALDDSLSALNKVFDSLQYCFSALKNTVTSADFTQSDLDVFKSNISTQNTLMATAISAVQSNKQNLESAILAYNTNVSQAEDALASAQASFDDALIAARNTLSTAKVNAAKSIAAAEAKVNAALESWQVAQAQLNKVLAPSNPYDINMARAQVRQAEAALDSISKRIEDSVIKAPLEGIITKLEYEVGEQAVAGKPVISMLGDSDFEIEVLISEADIAKVELKDPAEITLDAFGDDIKFSGQVAFIEPAETVIQDVIYYKVKVVFNPGDFEAKSGMTANVTITTAKKENVLLVPSRAVIERNGSGKMIRVLMDNKIEERSIVSGLRGDEGQIEILSGLEPGELVVTQIKEK